MLDISINVPEDSGINSAAELKKVFLNAINSQKPDSEIVLDISKIKAIDSSFIQLLAALKKQAELNGISIKILGHWEETPLADFRYCEVDGKSLMQNFSLITITGAYK